MELNKPDQTPANSFSYRQVDPLSGQTTQIINPGITIRALLASHAPIVPIHPLDSIELINHRARLAVEWADALLEALEVPLP